MTYQKESQEQIMEQWEPGQRKRSKANRNAHKQNKGKEDAPSN